VELVQEKGIGEESANQRGNQSINDWGEMGYEVRE